MNAKDVLAIEHHLSRAKAPPAPRVGDHWLRLADDREFVVERLLPEYAAGSFAALDYEWESTSEDGELVVHEEHEPACAGGVLLRSLANPVKWRLLSRQNPSPKESSS